jgi:hypothetical protein
MTEDKAPRGDRWMLLVGAGAGALALYKPLIYFKGRGDAVFTMAAWQIYPILTALAALVLSAAVATVFLPQFARWRREATVAAAIAVAIACIWAFVGSIDAWSSARALVLQVAGTRSTFINPHIGMGAMLLSVLLLSLSIILSRDESKAGQAAPRGASAQAA